MPYWSGNCRRFLLKFYSYPVATTFSNSRHATSFPDITFCNLYPVGEIINPNLTWKTYLDKVDAARSSISMADLVDAIPDKVITQNIFNGLWESLESSSIYFTNFPVYSGNPTGLPSILADCRYYAWDATESKVQCVNSIKTVSNAKFFKCFTMHLNDTFTEKVRSLALIFYINNFPGGCRQFHVCWPEQTKRKREWEWSSTVQEPDHTRMMDSTLDRGRIQPWRSFRPNALDWINHTTKTDAPVNHIWMAPLICTQPTLVSRYVFKNKFSVSATVCRTATNSARRNLPEQTQQSVGTWLYLIMHIFPHRILLDSDNSFA